MPLVPTGTYLFTACSIGEQGVNNFCFKLFMFTTFIRLFKQCFANFKLAVCSYVLNYF